MVSDKMLEYVTEGDTEVVLLNGIWYNNSPTPIDEFINRFNGVNEDGSQASRFMRLLTRKEMEWLNRHLIERNS